MKFHIDTMTSPPKWPSMILLKIFWFDRLEMSTSAAENSKRTPCDESSRLNIRNYLCFHFFKKTLLHTIKHTLFMSLCQNTCSDDIKHLHKSKQFQSSYDHFQFHLDSFLPLLFIINALFCKIYFHPVSKSLIAHYCS